MEGQLGLRRRPTKRVELTPTPFHVFIGHANGLPSHGSISTLIPRGSISFQAHYRIQSNWLLGISPTVSRLH